MTSTTLPLTGASRPARAVRPIREAGLWRLLAGLTNALSGSMLATKAAHGRPLGRAEPGGQLELAGAFATRELETITRFYRVADDALRAVVRAPDRMQALLELKESIDLDPELQTATASVHRTVDPDTGEELLLSVVLRRAGLSLEEAENAIDRIVESVGDLLRRARLVVDVHGE